MIDSDININVHVYTGNGFLRSVKEEIEKISEETLQKVISLIPVSDVDIEIYAGELRFAPEAGIIGHTENLHHITIAIMPQHPRFFEILREDLPKTIAHELCHIARWRALGLDKTFFDSLITEGIAGHFEKEVTQQNPSLCFLSLSEEEVEQLFPTAQEEFAHKDYDHYAWFAGSEEKHIPHWAGYSIGYSLVQKFLQKNPTMKASSLHTVPSSVFL